MKPRLLDLFCGAGGAAVGYYRAGFEVVGVDINPQPRYPFEFVQADALSVLRGMVDHSAIAGEVWRPGHFAAIHASPVCKAYTVAGHHWREQGREYPEQISPTRDLLNGLGVPWVIENVPGAPLRPDLKLCGCLFGLNELRRERWFETSWGAFDLRSPCYHVQPAITVAGHGEPRRSSRRKLGLPNATVRDWRRAMGIDWMTRDELSQAIPSAYTQFVGEQLLAALSVGAS